MQDYATMLWSSPRLRLLQLICICGWAFAPHRARSQDLVKTDDLLTAEALVKAQREGEAALAAFYANVRISATMSRRKSFGDASPFTRQHEFYRAGNLLRLEFTGRISHEGAELDRTRAWVANKADKSFQVTRLGASGKFALDEVLPDHVQISDDIFLNAPYSIAPFGFLEMRVSELLAAPGVIFGEVVKGKDDRGDFVTLHFRRTKFADGTPADVPCWIKFLPDRHWAVAEWSFGKNLPARGKVEYVDDAKIPLVKSFHVWIEDKTTGLVHGIEDYQVTSIAVARLPMSTFQLESFGIRAAP